MAAPMPVEAPVTTTPPFTREIYERYCAIRYTAPFPEST